MDCEAVRDYVSMLPQVAIARTYKYMCSNPGQDLIVQDIKEHGLERVVVAACSPRMHERTFRAALQKAGLNPYMFEMANIREQCSWVHDDAQAATEKTKALVEAAVRRVEYHEALEQMTVDMCPNSLVIGAGIAGLTAALELAEAGQKVFLLEKQDHLGGNLARVDLTAPYLDSARDLLTERITRVRGNDNIEVLLNSRLQKLQGYVGNFSATLAGPGGDRAPEDKIREVPVGNVIVCTGYKEFAAERITHFGYGKLPDVVTSFDFEKMLRVGRIESQDGKIPKYVAIIHCVGSRSPEYHGYCSRVCCMTALKYVHEIKSAIPDPAMCPISTSTCMPSARGMKISIAAPPR